MDDETGTPQLRTTTNLITERNKQGTTRGTQLLYVLPIDYAMDGSVDSDGVATAHESLVRSHLPASISLRSRQINIGRGGDGLGLILDIAGLAGLAMALFYEAPNTRAALDWWRRQLRLDGVEDVLVGAAQDSDAPPLAMSPDLAAMIALRHVEGEDRGAARLAWWDEVIIDRFDVFEGDGLEQSPERLYFFVIDYAADRTFISMRADGPIITEVKTVLPAGWMEYESERHPDLTELVDDFRADTAARRSGRRDGPSS